MQEALSSQPSTPNKTKPDNNNTKVRSGSRLHKHETLQKKKKKRKSKGLGVAQIVEHPPSKSKALASNPMQPKPNNKENNKI
jgi:hypothetical protein